MTDVCFYIFMISTSLFVVGMAIVASEVKMKDSGLYGETNHPIYFNPFKQLDFLLYVITRKYIEKSDRKLHIYDLLLVNMIVLVLSFICFSGIFSE